MKKHDSPQLPADDAKLRKRLFRPEDFTKVATAGLAQAFSAGKPVILGRA